MPESSLDFKDIPGGSFKCRMSPLRQFSQSSLLSLPLHRDQYMLGSFCTEDNVPECLSYINQELSSLGLPSLWTDSDDGGSGGSELDAVAVLNRMYDLIQLHRRALRTLEDLEVEQIKSSSSLETLQLGNTRLKDQVEHCKRENTGLLERERQLQLKVKSVQNCLKSEKEEVQKLQHIIANRASQYNHDLKRKEREFNKLRERLNQLLVDKKEKKQAIEVLNYIGRADGKRSRWKTGKTEMKHEGEMYRTLLSDYDSRHKDLLLENSELKKVLQQMKRDMMSILRSKKPTAPKRDAHQDAPGQSDSEEEEEMFDSSKDSVELSCVHAREQLTNSIRLQWRRLKSHVERLDSQASLAQAMGERSHVNTVPRETHDKEMERLNLEIQQCKDFIRSQQQLLQQQLSSPCDEETASLLNDCYMLEEKDRLREEWRTLGEQRRSLEKERRNFTEAAIRLSHERKSFEDDRATWLKHQFLNLTPFSDAKKPPMSKSKSAFSISEPDGSAVSTPEWLNECESHTSFCTPERVPVKTPSTSTTLHQPHHLIPENSPSTTKPKVRSPFMGEAHLCHNGEADARQWNCRDHWSLNLNDDKNSSI